MATNSEVITINPVEYTGKMQKVLENFRQLSQQAITVQAEPAVFNTDINNLAAYIYAMCGEKYAASRLEVLQTTIYEIESIGPCVLVKVKFLFSVDEYNHDVTFEIDSDTGEIVRTDTVFSEEVLDNGRIDRKVSNERKPARNPADIISHMSADMFMMARNYTTLSLGRIAS